MLAFGFRRRKVCGQDSEARSLVRGLARSLCAHFPRADFYVHSWSVEYAGQILDALQPVQARFDTPSPQFTINGCDQKSSSQLPQAESRLRVLELIGSSKYDLIISARFDVFPCQSLQLDIGTLALPPGINFVAGGMGESEGQSIPKLDDSILLGRLDTLRKLWGEVARAARFDMLPGHGVAPKHASRLCNPHTRLGIALVQVSNATERNVSYTPRPFLPFRRASARGDFGVGGANCQLNRTARECYDAFCARARPGFTAAACNVRPDPTWKSGWMPIDVHRGGFAAWALDAGVPYE